MYRTYYLRSTHNTQPQHTPHNRKKNTDTMISPARRLPAAPILQVSAIAVCRAIDLDLRNTAIQFFYVKLSNSLFYCLLFYRLLTSVHRDKRYVFFIKHLCFFSAVASNQRALTIAICRYNFCRCCLSSHSVLAWFRTGGGGGRRCCHGCRWRAEAS